MTSEEKQKKVDGIRVLQKAIRELPNGLPVERQGLLDQYRRMRSFFAMALLADALEEDTREGAGMPAFWATRE